MLSDELKNTIQGAYTRFFRQKGPQGTLWSAFDDC